MAAGQWEVVSSKSGKHKGGNDGSNKITKGQRKKYIDNMPKLDAVSPIQESQTMFDAFLEQERKKDQSTYNKANGNVDIIKGKKAPVQQKKKNQEKKKSQPPSKPPSLEEAVEALNVEDMRTLLATVEARFPDSPMIWLKDLVSYLNVKLNFEVTDPIFSTKPTGYPTSLLSPEIHELIINTLNHCTSQTLQLFFDYCLQTMIQDMVKGLHTLGCRIFLQCLAQEKPDIVVTNISKCVDSRNSYQNRQNVCVSILWAVGQAGNHNLEAGFKVWLELMFPLLGMRAYSKYVTDYLEKLLSSSEASVSAKNVIGVRELFPVLDFIHSPSGMSGNLQKQLFTLYPKLKSLSYGSDPESVLRNYFPSYLRRLEPNCSPSLKQEVLLSLLECLTKDKHCYSVWRQLYTKHLVQSSLLMAHLKEQWDNLPSTFPHKLLFETLSTFRVTNEEHIGQGKTSRSLDDCVNCCNELLAKMTARKFPWRNILILLTLAVSAILAYDIHIHGSFKDSKTGHLMKDAGLLAVCEQAWSKITVYTGKAYKWLEVNVPKFYARLCQICGPYLQLFWEKLFHLCIYIWNNTQGVRDWLSVNIPPLLLSINDNLPYYIEKCLKSVTQVSQTVQIYFLQLWSYIAYYLNIVGTWLLENVFTGSMSPENLQRYIGNTVEALQQYTLSTYHWFAHQISTVVSSGK